MPITLEAPPETKPAKQIEPGSFAPRDVVLVTGGMGFIGSHFIRTILSQNENLKVINVDCLTYAAAGGSRFQESTLSDSCWQSHPGDDLRHIWRRVDVTNFKLLREICLRQFPNYFVHFAAETHVDRAIEGAQRFVRTNVDGTASLLEAALQVYRIRHEKDKSAPPFKFMYVSTDEVYGQLPAPTHPGFREMHPRTPRNPYAATKAGAEMLVQAYAHTYGLPIVITRGANTYGIYQFPEKFVPVVILNALDDKPVPIYGAGDQRREWLHVQDHVDALWSILKMGHSSAYNIGSGFECTNISLARDILTRMGKPMSLISHVPDRPGHDKIYRMESILLRQQLGWEPKKVIHLCTDVRDSLQDVIDWYTTEGQEWVNLTQHHYQERLGLRE